MTWTSINNIFRGIWHACRRIYLIFIFFKYWMRCGDFAITIGGKGGKICGIYFIVVAPKG